jgi:putative PIN family toxin of toxin-antitoxin system
LLKAVIDTNLWIGSLIGTGPPKKIKDCLQAQMFQAVYAVELFDELLDVLARPKFALKIQATEASKLLQLIEEVAIFVKLDTIPSISCDPKDDMFLACAAISNSDYLVSGDPDLLDLIEYGKTKIVNPAQFLQILTQKK